MILSQLTPAQRERIRRVAADAGERLLAVLAILMGVLLMRLIRRLLANAKRRT